MPKGPRGEKRPADVIGAAIKVAKIATGEISEDVDEKDKDKAAQALGQRGGKARNPYLSLHDPADLKRIGAKAKVIFRAKGKGGRSVVVGETPVARLPDAPMRVVRALSISELDFINLRAGEAKPA